MADEPTPTPEPKPEKTPEELKGELTRRREETEALKAKLAKLEDGATKRKTAEEKAEAARKKAAGEFDGLEADYQGKIAAKEAALNAMNSRVAAFEAGYQTQIDAKLKDHPEAESIRADLEGIPVERQLGLVSKIVAASIAPPKPRGPTGDPASGDLGAIDVPAEIMTTAQSDAARRHPGDLDKQKTFVERFVASFKGVKMDRKERPIDIRGFGPKGGEA